MSVIIAIAALATTWASGLLIVHALWGPIRRGVAERVLVACVSLAIGAGLQSSAHYGAMRLGMNNALGCVLGDVAAMLCAIALWRVARHRTHADTAASAPPPQPPSHAPTAAAKLACAALAIAAIVSGALAIVYCVLRLERMPFGDHDAISMWNARARFFVLADEHWRDAFLFSVHADYPLMLQLTIARYWRYLGGTPQAVPMTIAVMSLALTWLTLVSGARVLRGAAAGWLAGLTLVAMPVFPQLSGMQYADIPLAFLLLATLIALALAAERPGSPGLLAVAGALAACAAWTKNEGLPFLFVATAVAAVFHPPRSDGIPPRGGAIADAFRGRAVSIGIFLLGAAPVLAALVLFKRSSPRSNDLVSGQSLHESLERLVSAERHATILSWLRGMFFQAQEFVPKTVNVGMATTSILIAAVILALAHREMRTPGRAAVMRLLALLASLVAAAVACEQLMRDGEPKIHSWLVAIPLGCLAISLAISAASINTATWRVLAGSVIVCVIYYVVYLLTPHELRWHLFTSLTRLFLHVWPTLVLGAMLVISSSIAPRDE